MFNGFKWLSKEIYGLKFIITYFNFFFFAYFEFINSVLIEAVLNLFTALAIYEDMN